VRRVLIFVAVLALAGCATGSGGLKRVALANEQAAAALQRIQQAADAAEQAHVACLAAHAADPKACDGVGLSTADRNKLSPGIIRAAQAGQALSAALVAADVPGTRAQIIGVLGVLSELTVTVQGLPSEVRITLIVAIEAARAALLVVSTEVAS